MGLSGQESLVLFTDAKETFLLSLLIFFLGGGG